MFRFTIRDVLWLTVVVGVSAGWLVDQGNKKKMLNRRDKRLHEMAQKLADETNKLIFMPNEVADKEYAVAPVNSQAPFDLPYLSIP